MNSIGGIYVPDAVTEFLTSSIVVVLGRLLPFAEMVAILVTWSS